jgi:hypothetical protein
MMSNETYPEFPTKAAARKYVKSLGYTTLIEVGQSGDGNFGTREYYKHAKKGDVSISKVAGVWLASFFPRVPMKCLSCGNSKYWHDDGGPCATPNFSFPEETK